MPYHKTYKIPYQKTSRILKKCLIMSKKDTLSKKNLIKNLKKVPYQGTLSKIYTKYLKRFLIKEP